MVLAQQGTIERLRAQARDAASLRSKRLALGAAARMVLAGKG